MTKKISYTIIKETNKALLIEAGDLKGWVQKRWAKNGVVSKATLEKAAANYVDFTPKQKKEDDIFCVEGLVVRETEKAILFETEIDYAGAMTRDVKIWLPKSRVSIDENQAKIPNWLVFNKMEEFAVNNIEPMFSRMTISE